LDWTSNQAIFEKAHSPDSNLYNDVLNSPRQSTGDANGVFEENRIRECKDACDSSNGLCGLEAPRGYVSLEVSRSRLRYHKAPCRTAPTLVESPGIRHECHIKSGTTWKGLPGHSPALEEGININITLLLCASAYEQVCRSVPRCARGSAAKGSETSAQIASCGQLFRKSHRLAMTPRLMKNLKAPRGRRPGRSASKAFVASSHWPTPVLTYRKRKYQERSAARVAGSRHPKGPDAAPAWASTQQKPPKYRCAYVRNSSGGTPSTHSLTPFDYFRDHGKLRPQPYRKTSMVQAKTMADLLKPGIS